MPSKNDVLAAFGNDFVTMLTENVEEFGVELADDLDAVAIYAAEQADKLSLAVGEPEFGLVVQSAADNVLLHSVKRAINRANDADQRVIGFVTGALRTAAGLLRAIVLPVP